MSLAAAATLLFLGKLSEGRLVAVIGSLDLAGKSGKRMEVSVCVCKQTNKPAASLSIPAKKRQGPVETDLQLLSV